MVGGLKEPKKEKSGKLERDQRRKEECKGQ